MEPLWEARKDEEGCWVSNFRKFPKVSNVTMTGWPVSRRNAPSTYNGVLFCLAKYYSDLSGQKEGQKIDPERRSEIEPETLPRDPVPLRPRLQA